MAAYYLQNLLQPVNQNRKLPVGLIYFTTVVEVIAFRANQKIFNLTTYRKTKQKQKIQRKESFAELKNI